MRCECGAVEGLFESVATAVVAVAIVAAALGALGIAFAAAIRWSRKRRGSTRAPEALFVGRWGVLGPELYLVGKRVRRLLGPDDPDHPASRGQPPPTALAFARRMLAEVMRCHPATRLARAFADAQLEPLPPDGFVLPRSDVEAWLDSREGPYEPADRDDLPHAA
jgi:hypothetical protein